MKKRDQVTPEVTEAAESAAKKTEPENEDESSELIFARQRKARQKRKKKIIIIAIVACAAAAAGLIVGINVLRSKVRTTFSSTDSSDVTSAEVTKGSISTTVSGSGTLADKDAEDIELPSGLEVADYYVEAGDTVKSGDLIATVTEASLMTQMSSLQDQIDAIDEKLNEASDDTVSGTISSSVAGRVKKIYAAAGDDVATVMYNNGALLRLSLDGYMAVDVETEDLLADQQVTVTTSDGTAWTGTVEKVVDGTATVLITDNGPALDDTVTVAVSDTETVSGTLYIHSSMAVTGYTGTISSVNVSENASVSNGTSLFTLTDTSSSAAYDTLLEQRQDLEDDLSALISIYKQGGIVSPIDGEVSDTAEDDESEVTTTSSAYSTSSSSGSSSSSSDTVIATVLANKEMTVDISVDETDILSVEKGQSAKVSVSAVSEDSYDGSVTAVNKEGTSSNGVSTYTVTVTLDKADGMLSGMSASVVITIEGKDNALLIPTDALHQTSTTSYVYTSYNEETGEFGDMKEVTVGISNDSYVEIESGLAEGDTVYYTESDSSSAFDFMGGGQFDMGSMPSGGDMPSGGGEMPSMPSGGNGGGNGGGMPSGGGNGGMPSGGQS